MNYKKKRKKAGINFTTMVQYLGIPEEKYREVEESKRGLEGEYLDKFLEIIKNGKEYKFNDMVKEQEVNQWIESKQIIKDMEEYGYNQKELAKANETAQSVISEMINGNKGVSMEKKFKIYNFLHDSLNKKLKEERATRKKGRKAGTKLDKEDFYINWVVENIKEYIEKSEKSQAVMCKDLGVSNGYLCHLKKGDAKPSKEMAKKLYDYFSNTEQSEEIINEEPIQEVIEEVKQEPVVEEIKIDEDVEEPIKEIKDEIMPDYKTLQKLIDEQEKKMYEKDFIIEKLKRQIMLYEKLIERL